MTMPSLRTSHWLLFASVAVLFFSLALWMSKQSDRAEPLPWLVDWQESVIVPMAEGDLPLEKLAELAPGELWLQPRDEGPRLVYRTKQEREEGVWRLEGELELSDGERDSLSKALGKGTDEQPLSGEMLEQLGGHRVSVLNMVPMAEVSAARLAASIGPPRLRLRTGEGEAWIYPQQGLSAHLLEGNVQLLHLVPREAMKH
ncbi:hypothetical protein SA496_27265 [Pseudomonas sp. JS3066]|jgi:hypothetical protein|uniref:hypothetical protein n=1 Tax=unclassified Pseudomonas TaxID=196821 RepID=UPI000EAA81F6|nr:MULTISPECIES: hypothetical protein [unclassified Pseudomonas]AYF89094.1 hypothetical protein D6Z43_18810 [Pseudomonas sp. DY-1]MDH4653294.1 hypothetical protein [Pseudomonas sp. BN606]MRK20985.1 hypothetical protein [Pseudomonas sp. JG-B]WVK93363.1 hypothetical protein SA496_27265 [Pseudomonas sp. JS3066]